MQYVTRSNPWYDIRMMSGKQLNIKDRQATVFFFFCDLLVFQVNTDLLTSSCTSIGQCVLSLFIRMLHKWPSKYLIMYQISQ